jgi:DamX protein
LFAVLTRIRDHHPSSSNGAGIIMAENKESGVHNDPFAPNLSLEERLRALELAYAEPAFSRPATNPRLAELTSRLEKLTAEVAAQSNRLRDQEKSMVERIADVDDDRRLTTLQLQRGWQAQRDGFANQVHRKGRLMMALMAPALISFGLITYFTRPRPAAPATLVDEVAALQQELTKVTQEHAQLQERIKTFSTTVESPAQAPDVAGSPAPDQAQGADAKVLAKQLERLTVELQRQGNELDAMRHTLRKADKGPQNGVPATDAPHSAASGTDNNPPRTTASESTQSQPRKHTTKISDRPFALQLVGDSNRDRLLEYASRSGLPETVYVYQGTRRGQPWFVLVHSLHPTSSEARTALEQIPAKQRVRTPWIRSLPKGTELEIIEQKPGHN